LGLSLELRLGLALMLRSVIVSIPRYQCYGGNVAETTHEEYDSQASHARTAHVMIRLALNRAGVTRHCDYVDDDRNLSSSHLPGPRPP